MNIYLYDGPVLEFGKLVSDHWKAKTVAPSEAKARANIIYQFKLKTDRSLYTPVTLPGRIVMVEGTE